MSRYIWLADRISMWFGKAFAWAIMVMTLGVGYEVFVRYVLGTPTAWAFDLSYITYGALFMMGGAYTLSRDAHVRGDFLYRLWRPRTQGTVELILYFIFFFPGIIALIAAGWKYASRSLGYMEVSVYSPANIPIFQLKLIIVAAGLLMFIQGVARVCRCIIAIRDNRWPPLPQDVEELDKEILMQHEREVLRHHGEAVDVKLPGDATTGPDRRDRS
jgi:TRAP-type mannitol/chloroaromatic compound transport system permease small subunit